MVKNSFITGINKDNATFTTRAIQRAQDKLHEYANIHKDLNLTESDYNDLFISYLAQIVNNADTDETNKIRDFNESVSNLIGELSASIESFTFWLNHFTNKKNREIFNDTFENNDKLIKRAHDLFMTLIYK